MPKSNKGFTLIEMLVVMFIVVLMSSLMLVNFRSSKKSYILSQAAQKLISDIRKTQNMAMSGVNPEGSSIKGYGIYVNDFVSDSYVIFADQDDDQRYDGGEAIKTVTLPDQIEVYSVSPWPVVHIFFQPPNPTTYINQDNSPGESGTIILRIKGEAVGGPGCLGIPPSSTINKTIVVSTTGLIQIY